MQRFQSERYELARERIASILAEMTAGQTVSPSFSAFFLRGAQWFGQLVQERDFIEAEGLRQASEAELAQRNRALYEEILPARYETSFANPAYASSQLGREYGPLCAALFYEWRSAIPFVYEGAQERVLPRMELFLEIYGAFAQQYREDVLSSGKKAGAGIPEYRFIRQKVYAYLSDYAQEEAEYEICQKLTADAEDYARDLIRDSDPAELRCIYAFGEYIGENERGTAEYLRDLPEETIARMAATYTEGYRIGFEVTGKDLSQKKTVGIIYRLGFERMVRRAMENFAAMGLTSVFYREVPTLFRLLRSGKSGYAGGDANPQYLYDHREDLALFLDDTLVNRKLEALENAYREHRSRTELFAGPAVIETFGEKLFSPVEKAERSSFGEVQQKWMAAYQTKASLLYNEAVIGRNRSFTIIAFPVPEIAEGWQEETERGVFSGQGDQEQPGWDRRRYAEIFDAVIEINTLDYQKYSRIQATLIETLNRAESVRVRGQRGNRTDLTVRLWKMADPERETIFENCVADVNIPVGEVFTTPVLSGTNGVLHVSAVFLNGLQFRDLELTFEEGRVTEYSCGNFADPAQGRKYIEDNILFHHDRLPMGEFAIGTNTTAYAAARRFGIADRLPILIAEKTGPHFAVGDTCYSHEEDNRQYNPDGREIVAKENDVSLLRRTNPGKAYFGCHTDITMPFEELGELAAVTAQGEVVPLIREGRFVLPGTLELNEPLEG
ncbi:MAG: aminopeptidase [Eubacteriales bacterium]|nr:aminopeptidase [Eubacteriales bacterium]